jgi:hypothetical protein
MFDANSRYTTVDDYVVPDAQGRPVKIKKIRFIPNTPATVTRQITAADRPDLLAYAYYQAADRFWRIADANQVMDPAELFIPIGRRIWIPSRT